MKERTKRYRPGRRRFLRIGAAALGLSMAGVTALLAFLNKDKFHANAKPEHSPNFGGTRGGALTLHNQTLYFAGTNTYYLHYQSHVMIDDILKNAVAMGLSVVRMWGFMNGKGNSGIVMQSQPGVYPEEGYERFDYTVRRAGELGLALVVVLVNNWDAFGGMNQYVQWFGGGNHDEFYRKPEIKAAYKQYIQHLLQRTNRYTGRTMLEETAILAWELANEPRCESDPSGNTLCNWVDEMSTFLKSLDSHHLVSVGDEGFYNIPGRTDWTHNGSLGVDWKRLLALTNIDYGTLHLYPQHWGYDGAWAEQWISEHLRDGQAAGKPVVLEEFGWSDLATRDATYRAWTDLVYQQGGAGDLFWLLTGQKDDGSLYPDFDGYCVTYPSSTANILAAHAAKMRGKSGKSV